MDLFFSADLGDNGEAHIEAERYNPEVENVSKFSWKTGATTISAADLLFFWEQNEGSLTYVDATGYYGKWQNIMDQLQTALNQEGITLKVGGKQAEQMLKDLNIQNLVLLSAQKTLWFPDGSTPKEVASFRFDQVWQANSEKAKIGYEYTFTHAVSGFPVNQMAESYAPPFQVENVTKVVTVDGVKSFLWEGMCEEVSTVTENTKLFPFEDIQNNLFGQIYY